MMGHEKEVRGNKLAITVVQITLATGIIIEREKYKRRKPLLLIKFF